MFLQMGLDIFPAFTPTVDSESSNLFLSENPLQLLRNGTKIPIMFGYNSQEGNFFISAISKYIYLLLLFIITHYY